MWFGYKSVFHVLRKCAFYSLCFFGTHLAQQNWRCGYCSWTVATLFDFSINFLSYQWVPCTVHGTYKFHFSSIFSLKMDLTVLFTYLKIILLQCFQFLVSVFSKISYIQAHPMYAFGLRFWFVRLCFPFSFSFLFIYLLRSGFTWEFVCQWVLCTVHKTYYLFD